MEEKLLTPSYEYDSQIFKSIRLEYPYFGMIGSFRYLRTMYDEYDYEKGDILDDKLLEMFCFMFDKAQIEYSEYLLLAGQLEELILKTKHSSVHGFLIMILPKLNYETYGRRDEFKQYTLSTAFNYSLSDTSKDREFNNMVATQRMIYLPPDPKKMAKLAGSMKNVIYESNFSKRPVCVL